VAAGRARAVVRVLHFPTVRRFLLTALLAILAFSASDAYALFVPEPCVGYEAGEKDNGACPPTCVTCGCCAQSVEPVNLQIVATPDVPIVAIDAPAPRLSKTQSRDILHVPKRLVL
jgi:hypothetical protein